MEFSTQPLTSGNDADVDLEQFIGRRYISPSGYLTDVALRIVLSLGTVETQLEDTTLPFGPGHESCHTHRQIDEGARHQSGQRQHDYAPYEQQSVRPRVCSFTSKIYLILVQTLKIRRKS